MEGQPALSLPFVVLILKADVIDLASSPVLMSQLFQYLLISGTPLFSGYWAIPLQRCGQIPLSCPELKLLAQSLQCHSPLGVAFLRWFAAASCLPFHRTLWQLSKNPYH